MAGGRRMYCFREQMIHGLHIFVKKVLVGGFSEKVIVGNSSIKALSSFVYPGGHVSCAVGSRLEAHHICNGNRCGGFFDILRYGISAISRKMQ